MFFQDPQQRLKSTKRLRPQRLYLSQSQQLKFFPNHRGRLKNHQATHRLFNLTLPDFLLHLNVLDIHVNKAAVDFHGNAWQWHSREVVQLLTLEEEIGSYYFAVLAVFMGVLDSDEPVLEKVHEILQADKRVATALLHHGANDLIINAGEGTVELPKVSKMFNPF